ncbi:hypothetical protein BC629DRAFT_1228671 [Irpex lacteus]|nr:hypothetical protein BC629DRAFT_1228671 [Irpex lacteus]
MPSYLAFVPGLLSLSTLVHISQLYPFLDERSLILNVTFPSGNRIRSGKAVSYPSVTVRLIQRHRRGSLRQVTYL